MPITRFKVMHKAIPSYEIGSPGQIDLEFDLQMDSNNIIDDTLKIDYTIQGTGATFDNLQTNISHEKTIKTRPSQTINDTITILSSIPNTISIDIVGALESDHSKDRDAIVVRIS